jgi:D-tyrosyl-tRNA(Tyr) deacylase
LPHKTNPMKAVLQRVSEASVTVNGDVTGSIGKGFLILLGITTEDNEAAADWLARKIVGMRVFGDEAGHMNLDLKAIDGELLVVSQFTLMADYRKGNRPSFTGAARPGQAIPLYEHFLNQLEALHGKRPQTGIFGADMKVALVNDGPVTILTDSEDR